MAVASAITRLAWRSAAATRSRRAASGVAAIRSSASAATMLGALGDDCAQRWPPRAPPGRRGTGCCRPARAALPRPPAARPAVPQSGQARRSARSAAPPRRRRAGRGQIVGSWKGASSMSREGWREAADRSSRARLRACCCTGWRRWRSRSRCWSASACRRTRLAAVAGADRPAVADRAAGGRGQRQRRLDATVDRLRGAGLGGISTAASIGRWTSA